MNNIVFKSILYILASYIFFVLIIFFNSYSFSLNSFINISNFVLNTLMGLILTFSQFILVHFENKKTNRDIILNTIICVALYSLLFYFLSDFEQFNYKKVILDDYYIERTKFNNFNLLSIDLVKQFISIVNRWRVTELVPFTGFSLLLLNISLQSFFKRFSEFNTILNVFIFIVFFVFALVFWNFRFNIYLISLSLLLLFISEDKV